MSQSGLHQQAWPDGSAGAENESDVHKKLQKLRSYRPFVESIVSKLESRPNSSGSEQLQKMRMLHKFILDQDIKNCKMDTLDKMVKLLQGICQKHVSSYNIDKSEINKDRSKKSDGVVLHQPSSSFSSKNVSKESGGTVISGVATLNSCEFVDKNATNFGSLKANIKPSSCTGNKSLSNVRDIEYSSNKIEAKNITSLNRDDIGTNHWDKSKHYIDAEKSLLLRPASSLEQKGEQSSLYKNTTARLNSLFGEDNDIKSSCVGKSTMRSFPNTGMLFSLDSDSSAFDNATQNRGNVHSKPGDISRECSRKSLLDLPMPPTAENPHSLKPRSTRWDRGPDLGDSVTFQDKAVKEVNPSVSLSFEDLINQSSNSNTTVPQFHQSRMKLRMIAGLQAKTPPQPCPPPIKSNFNLPPELTELLKNCSSKAVSSDDVCFIEQTVPKSEHRLRHPSVESVTLRGREYVPRCESPVGNLKEKEHVFHNNASISGFKDSNFSRRFPVIASSDEPPAISREVDYGFRHESGIDHGYKGRYDSHLHYSDSKHSVSKYSDMSSEFRNKSPLLPSKLHTGKFELSSAHSLNKQSMHNNLKSSPSTLDPCQKEISIHTSLATKESVFSDEESSNFSTQDTPVSPEPEDIPSFSPPKESPVKTIPIEKVPYVNDRRSSTDRGSSDRTLRDYSQSISVDKSSNDRANITQVTRPNQSSSIAGYRYEDFIGPPVKLKRDEKRFDTPLLPTPMSPTKVPKPPPLTSTLIDTSPLKKNAIENRQSSDATKTVQTKGEITHKSQRDSLQFRSIESSKTSKIGFKGQSGSLNIEEYRRRRAMKNTPKFTNILDELIPETSSAISGPSVSIEKSNMPENPNNEFVDNDFGSGNSTTESFQTSYPGISHNRPFHSSTNEFRNSPTDFQQRNRDPRLPDGRQRLQGFSGSSHQNQNPYKSHSSHAGSGYLHPSRGSSSNSVHSKVGCRDPRSAGNQGVHPNFSREHHIVRGPRPHNGQIGYSTQMNFNQTSIPNKFGMKGPNVCPPYSAPHQMVMYGMNISYPQPQSPVPPPLSAGTPEPVRGISNLISNSFTCVIMKGLPQFTNSLHIYKFFQNYILKDVCIELDHGLNCTGTAYIQFPSHDSAAESLQELNGYIMHGFQVSLGSVTNGFFRGAKNTYDSRNFDRERRLGIPQLPPGNCNPFYDPKRVEKRLIAKNIVKTSAPSTVSEPEIEPEPLPDLGCHQDISETYVDASFEVEETKRSIDNTPKDKLNDATASNHMQNRRIKKDSVRNKKERRYRKIVIQSDSEADTDDEDKDSKIGLAEEQKHHLPQKTEDAADAEDSKLVIADDASSSIKAPANEFNFPVAENNDALNDEAVLSEKEEDAFEFEEVQDDFITSDTDCKKSEEPERGDFTRTTRSSKNKVPSLVSSDGQITEAHTVSTQKKKRTKKESSIAASLIVKMTRQTQVEVEKVFVDVNKLKVSIPIPKKLVESLFNEKSLNSRTKKAVAKMLDCTNKHPQSCSSSNETVSLYDKGFISKEEEPVGASASIVSNTNKELLDRSNVSDKSEASETDALFIDLNDYTKEQVLEPPISYPAGFTHGRTESISFNDRACNLNKGDANSLTNEVSSSEKFDALAKSGNTDSKKNVEDQTVANAEQRDHGISKSSFSDSNSITAVVMMADSTMSDDEPVILDHDHAESSADSMLKTVAESVVDSSQASNDEPEILEIASNFGKTSNNVNCEIGQQNLNDQVVSTVTTQTENNKILADVERDNSNSETEVIDLDEDDNSLPEAAEEAQTIHASIIIDDDSEDEKQSTESAAVRSNSELSEKETVTYGGNNADTLVSSGRHVSAGTICRGESSDCDVVDISDSSFCQASENASTEQAKQDTENSVTKTGFQNNTMSFGTSTVDPIVLDSDSEEDVQHNNLLNSTPFKRSYDDSCSTSDTVLLQSPLPSLKKAKIDKFSIETGGSECNLQIESVTSLHGEHVCSEDVGKQAQTEMETNRGESALATDLDLTQPADLFGAHTLADDDLPDLSQLIPGIDDDVLLNNLPDVSTLTSITDPRILDDNVPPRPKQTLNVNIDEKRVVDSTNCVQNETKQDAQLSEDIHSLTDKVGSDDTDNTVPEKALVDNVSLLEKSVEANDAQQNLQEFAVEPKICSTSGTTVVSNSVASGIDSSCVTNNNVGFTEIASPTSGTTVVSNSVANGIDSSCVTNNNVGFTEIASPTSGTTVVSNSVANGIDSSCVTNNNVGFTEIASPTSGTTVVSNSVASGIDSSCGTNNNVGFTKIASPETVLEISDVTPDDATEVGDQEIKLNSNVGNSQMLTKDTVSPNKLDKPNIVQSEENERCKSPSDKQNHHTEIIVSGALETSSVGNLSGASATLALLSEQSQRDLTITPDSDGDDSVSVGLASVSSFPDDLSVMSGEGRDLKTPDSSGRRRRKRGGGSSVVERRRVTRGSIVEKPEVSEPVHWDDGGVVGLFQCDLCQYVGRQHVNHIINYHSERELTCEFKKEDVSLVFRDKVGPSNLDNDDIPEVLDLSWVPEGLQFEEAVTCIAEDCNYISNIRFDLLYHYIEHCPKSLPTLYHCRLCQHMTNNLEVSYDHFTSHTGEYRHKCNKCGYCSYSIQRLEDHHEGHHKGTETNFLSTDLILGDDWPYIHICKSCLFTQIQFHKLEAHNLNKHGGRAEIVKANMFRTITLHADRYKRDMPPREKGKGKKTKKDKYLEKKVFIGDESRDEKDEEEDEMEAKQLVDRISQNIFTTRTAGEIKQKMSQLDTLSKKLQGNWDKDEVPENEQNIVSDTVDMDAITNPVENETQQKLVQSENNQMNVVGAIDDHRNLGETTDNGDTEAMELSEQYKGVKEGDGDAASGITGDRDLVVESETRFATGASTRLTVFNETEMETGKETDQSEKCDDVSQGDDSSDGELRIDEDADSEEDVVSTVDPFEVCEALSGALCEDSADGFALSDTIRKLSQNLKTSFVRCESPSSSSESEESSLGNADQDGDDLSADGSDLHEKQNVLEQKSVSDASTANSIAPATHAITSSENDMTITATTTTAIDSTTFLSGSLLTLSESPHKISLNHRCSHVGCSFEFSTTEALLQHQLKVHGPFKCSFYFCNYSTASEQHFVVHYQTHPQTNSYGCAYQCSTTVDSVERLIQHYKDVHVNHGAVPAQESDSSCFLRIESVSTLDPNSAKQMFGEVSPASSHPLSPPPAPAGPVFRLPAPSQQHHSTTLFPSAAIFPNSPSPPHEPQHRRYSETPTSFSSLISSCGGVASTHQVLAPVMSASGYSSESSRPVSMISSSSAVTGVATSTAVVEAATGVICSTASACTPDGVTSTTTVTTSTPNKTMLSVVVKSEFGETLPHGHHLLPKDAPTVPILYVFQQHQSVAAFRVYTGRRSADVFKCMQRGCIYSCNSVEQFSTHTAQHTGEHRCCYCLIKFTAGSEMVRHVLEEHSHCGYMCKHCLYRSTSTLYLGSHMKNFHPTEQPRYVKVTIINTEAPPNPPVEKFIHAYQCGYEGCTRRTVDAEMFRSHVNSSHGVDAVLRCFLCTCTGTVGPLVQHMREHMMDEFQCPYCLYGESERERLLTHLVNCHPGRSGKVLLRKQDQHDAAKSGSSSSSTPSPQKSEQAPSTTTSQIPRQQIVVPVGGTVQQTQLLQQKPSSTFYSNYTPHGQIPALPANSFLSASADIGSTPGNRVSSPLSVVSNTMTTSHALRSIISVTPVMTTKIMTSPRRFSVDTEGPAGSCSPGLQTSLPTTLLWDNGTSSGVGVDTSLCRDSDTLVNVCIQTNESALPNAGTQLASNASQGYPLRRTRSSLNNSESNSGECGQSVEDESSAPPSTCEKVGLSGRALYCCGNQSCPYCSDTLAGLKEHLQVCDLARDTPMLRCRHCTRHYRHLSALLDHIKVHGLKKYQCGAPGCDYKATMLHYFRNHTRQMHGTCAFRAEVKDPTVKDPENQEFIVMPRDASAPTKETHKKRKYEYEVSDIDKIPMNHVSYTSLRCYHCQFSSKIRLNLIKHLQLHLKYPEGMPQRENTAQDDNSVAGTNPIPVKQPINPVPCLERKELMFDKMMNLAGSSFEDKKRLEEVDLRLKNPIPHEEYENLPGFVAESQLNACGVEGCKYISSDEIMLKYHIRSLHGDVSQFPCPHCKNTSITVEKISSHFKLHGEKLFRCGWCPYLSFRRPVVERHTREKHPSKRPFEFVIRDPDDNKMEVEDTKTDLGDGASSSTFSGVGVDGATGGAGAEPQWQCGNCKFQSVTQQAMVTHTSLKHDVKSQYKCGYCNVKSSVMRSFDEHFAAKHPNHSFKVLCMFYRLDADDIEPLNKGDAANGKHEPLWRRNDPLRLRQIRGILVDESGNFSRTRQPQVSLADLKPGLPDGENFVCPKCLSFRNPCVNTFRSHLCKEADYHRYECSDCGFTTPLLPTLRRHYSKTHHVQFHNDSYLMLPIDDEKEAWVESIISHHQHHIKLYKEQKHQSQQQLQDSDVKAEDTSSDRTVPRLSSPPRPSSLQGARLTRRSSQGSGHGEDLYLTPPASGVAATLAAPVPTTAPVAGFICEVCELECKTLAGFVSHVKASHQNRYRCLHCEYLVGSKVLLEAHFRQKHPAKAFLFVDIDCDDTITVDSSSAAVIESDSTDDADMTLPLLGTRVPAPKRKKTHKCQDCPYECTSAKLYYRHCKTHVNNRPYLCSLCDMRFRDMRAAKQHSRLIHAGDTDGIIYAPLLEAESAKTPTYQTPTASSTASEDDTSGIKVNEQKKKKKIFLPPPPFVIDEEFDELPDLEAPVEGFSGVAIKEEKKEFPESADVKVNEMKKLSLEDSKNSVGLEFVCCHCGHKGDGVEIGEHMRSQHKDMPFIVRKKKDNMLTLEIYHYSCIYCNNGSDSLMEAMGHWVKQHVTLDFKFNTTLHTSKVIDCDAKEDNVKPEISNIKSESFEAVTIASGVRGPKAALPAMPSKRCSRSSNPLSEDEPNSSYSNVPSPPRKRAKPSSDVESSSSQTVPNTSTSEEEMESESELTSDLETTVDSSQGEREDKVYRCSSCRRTSKIKDEIWAHQQEKHGGSLWCSIIELSPSTRARSQRRLVKCRVCAFMGFREQVSHHGTTQHPEQRENVVCPLLPSDRGHFRCDVCQYSSKARKNVQRHLTTVHGSTANGRFSRYAHTASAEPVAGASGGAGSGGEGNEDRDGDDHVEYRCSYCKDLAHSYEELKAHHDFLHSHLPFISVDNVNAAHVDVGIMEVTGGGDSPVIVQKTSIVTAASDANPSPGPILGGYKATARKSFSFAPGSSHVRKRITRGYACKSSRAVMPSDVLHTSLPPPCNQNDKKEESESGKQPHSTLPQPVLSHPTTGTGGVERPPAFAATHLGELCNFEPRVMLKTSATLQRDQQQ